MRHILNTLEESIISLLLAAMTILVFFEVVMRFGFSSGVLWAQELTLHLSAWMVLFGASYGIKAGSHIGVDALVKVLPKPMRRLVSSLAALASIVYCGLFMYGSWVYLEKIHMIGIELEDMPIPKWIAHSILLIGLGMLALRLMQLLYQIATGRADGFKLVDEAKDSMYLAEEATSGNGRVSNATGSSSSKEDSA